MDNLISLYRGLPGNRQFSGIQGLPYFVFNPLRNILFTKEDKSVETQNEILLGEDDEPPQCQDGYISICENESCKCFVEPPCSEGSVRVCDNGSCTCANLNPQ